MATSLDPAKTSVNIVLSNANRTATRSTGTPYYASTLSTTSGVNKLLYVETRTTTTGDSSCGVSNAVIPDSNSTGTTNWLGWDTNSIGLYQDQVWFNGVSVGSLATVPNVNDVIATAVDRPSQQIWFRNVTKNEAWWPSPTTGYSIAAIGNGTLYFGFTLSVGEARTVNFDGTFIDTSVLSPTYVRWDGSPIGAYPLPAAVGTLTLSGQAVALRHACRLPATIATIVASGQAVATRAARRVAVVQGALTLAGQPITLRFNHRTVIALGAINFGGQTVNLINSSSPNKVLPASAGVLGLSGPPIVLLRTTGMARLSAATGNLVFTTGSVDLRTTRVPPPILVLPPSPSKQDYLWYNRGPSLHKQWHRR